MRSLIRSKLDHVARRWAVAVTLCTVPSIAHAQSFPATYRSVELCQDPYSRSTKSCTLARINFQPTGFGTHVLIGLTNLQGTAPASVQASALYGFGLVLNGGPASTAHVTQVNATLGGTAVGPVGGWTWENQAVAIGNVGYHAIVGTAINPIVGCTNVGLGRLPAGFSTCGRGAWAEFGFDVPNTYALNDITGFSLGDYQLPNVYGPLVAVTYCGFEYDGRQSCELVSDTLVTPEPTSLLLILLGVAPVALVIGRKRREAKSLSAPCEISPSPHADA